MHTRTAITLCIADPSKIYCEGLVSLFKPVKEIKSVFYTFNSELLLKKLHAAENLPDICVISSTLTTDEGENTIKEINNLYPDIKCIAICECNGTEDLYQLLEYGIKAQICKSQGFSHLVDVILRVKEVGYFYDQFMDSAIADHFRSKGRTMNGLRSNVILTERQKEFMRYCCTEMSYKEIAAKMRVSSTTVNKFREVICAKLHVRTRVGIVMYTIESGVYMLQTEPATK